MPATANVHEPLQCELKCPSPTGTDDPHAGVDGPLFQTIPCGSVVEPVENATAPPDSAMTSAGDHANFV